jgi:hypothetical protein
MEEFESNEDVPATNCVAKKNVSFSLLARHFELAFVGKRNVCFTYFVPLARGSSPWRPDAVVGTTGREHDRRPPGFHGPVGGLPNAPETGAPCQPSGPFSERVDSRAVRTRPASDARDCQGGKRTLLGASTGVPGLPRVAASVRPPPRFGDLDPIPFRPRV